MKFWIPAAVAICIASCASTTQYAATTGSTARVRLVAQGAGNGYFAVPQQLKCSSKFGNPLDDGDQLIAALHGKTTSLPKFGKQRILGMPGASAHPEWTFAELDMDAGRETFLRTTFVLRAAGLNPYDFGMCNSLTSVKFEAGKDYEVVFSANHTGCSVSFFELRLSGQSITREPIQPTSGPKGCK